MTDIRFSCSACGHHLVIDDAAGGRTVHCPECQTPNRVPLPAEPLPPRFELPPIPPPSAASPPTGLDAERLRALEERLAAAEQQQADLARTRDDERRTAEKDRDESRQQLARLEQQAAELRGELEGRAAELRELRRERDQALERVRALSEQNRELRAGADLAEKERDQVRERLADQEQAATGPGSASGRLAALEAERQTLAQERNDLRERLRLAENSTRDTVSARPIEPAPAPEPIRPAPLPPRPIPAAPTAGLYRKSSVRHAPPRSRRWIGFALLALTGALVIVALFTPGLAGGRKQPLWRLWGGPNESAGGISLRDGMPPTGLEPGGGAHAPPTAGLNMPIVVDGVRITVKSARLDRVERVSPAGERSLSDRNYLLLDLALENTAAEPVFLLRAWDQSTLADNLGSASKPAFPATFSVDQLVGTLSAAEIAPGGTLTDLVIFEPPPEGAQSFTLVADPGFWRQTPGGNHTAISRNTLRVTFGREEISAAAPATPPTEEGR